MKQNVISDLPQIPKESRNVIGNSMYIKNGKIITESDVIHGFIGIENGIITMVGGGQPPDETPDDIDAQGNLVTPGFIDIHCHGGGGVLFADDPVTAYTAHLKNGTTGILPTIGYNMPLEKFLGAVASIARMEEKGVLGINCEGPFINPAYGADTRLARNFNPEDAHEIYNAGKGRIRIWMFSPEIPGAAVLREFIVSKPEITACAGHTECSAEDLEGIGLICHLFDAMGPKTRKIPAIHESGTAEAVLASDDLYAELIADSGGVHVPGDLLKIAYRCLGDRCIVISDAISTMDNGPDINYNQRGELAGSLLSVSRAVVNMKNHTGISWPAAVRLGSLNPAKLLGLEKIQGSIEPGKKADIVVMDENAGIIHVIQDGRIIK